MTAHKARVDKRDSAGLADKALRIALTAVHQLMKLGWRVLLPLSLANVLVTGVVWLVLDQAGATTP